MVHPGARPNAEEGKPPPRNPGQVGGNTPDLASRRRPPAWTTGAVFALPKLASWGPPQVWRTTQAPLLGRRWGRSLAWVVVAGRVVGEEREAVVAAIAIVVVAAAVGAVVELVG